MFAFLCFRKLFLRFLKFFLSFCCFDAGFFKLYNDFLLIFLYSGYSTLKLDITFIHQRYRSIDNTRFKAEFSRNFKCIRLSRKSNFNPICRCKCIHIELHRCIFNAIRRKCIFLELRIMGGCNDMCTFFFQGFKHSDAKRCSLSGISSRAHFVEQYQRLFVCICNNVCSIEHMRGECAQIIFDTLFIPNFRINFLEYRNIALFITRNV